MSNILSIAVGGLTQAASRVLTNAKVIVNASSTSENGANQTTKSEPSGSTDPTAALVDLQINSTVYGANAVVVKTARKLDKALLDTLA